MYLLDADWIIPTGPSASTTRSSSVSPRRGRFFGAEGNSSKTSASWLPLPRSTTT